MIQTGLNALDPMADTERHFRRGVRHREKPVSTHSIRWRILKDVQDGVEYGIWQGLNALDPMADTERIG